MELTIYKISPKLAPHNVRQRTKISITKLQVSKNIMIESPPGNITEWTNIGGIEVQPGKAHPFGAIIGGRGVQFSLFSRHAASVSLLLFDNERDSVPAHEIKLDPRLYRTGDCWHVLVRGIKAGQLYLYRVDGPYQPFEGHRFNKYRVLIDPYAKALTGNFRWDISSAFGFIPSHPDADLSFSTREDISNFPKCIVISDSFDWEDDKPLNYPLSQTIIYEAHVVGLSAHPEAQRRFKIKNPGTFSSVAQMIPYLKELGITSLELLPVAEFDTSKYRDRINPISGEPLENYWGYSTIAFFAPKSGYACSGARGEQVAEFKQMVKELHRFGIEIILDIVFNHSGEGNQMGHTLSFKGIDNKIYYILAPNPRFYLNYSGCGNTLNCNHPIMQEFILECLHYWVQEMHIDGFRFDLGSVLARDSKGRLMDNPPVLERIAQDPLLSDTKIIAEAWDAGGAYQVGQFPGGRWAEWNDRYRDDVRSFWRGDPHKTNSFATRLTGSEDLYTGRKPYHSINYITAHDGFTLADLVSYEAKHNQVNGEDNRDGSNNNLGKNWGVEGPTKNRKIRQIRSQMIHNFLGTLLISSGTPMLLGGDEFRRTQNGNNNAYCQNNPISWLNYSLIEQYPETHRFVRFLIEFRKTHPALQRQEFFKGRDSSGNAVPDIGWFCENGRPMNWDRPENILGLRIDGSHRKIRADDDADICMFFNATKRTIRFLIPQPRKGQTWGRVIDTAQPSPRDILEPGKEQLIDNATHYQLLAHSLVVLIGIRAPHPIEQRPQRERESRRHCL